MRLQHLADLHIDLFVFLQKPPVLGLQSLFLALNRLHFLIRLFRVLIDLSYLFGQEVDVDLKVGVPLLELAHHIGVFAI